MHIGFSRLGYSRRVQTTQATPRQLTLSKALLPLTAANLLLLSGCGLGGSLLGLGSKEPADIQTVPATKDLFQQSLITHGEVESSNSTDIICEVSSPSEQGVCILWVAPEGSQVSRGDKVIEFDTASLEEQIKNQRVIVANAEATVIRSKADVETARISLKQYLEGTYVSERKQLLSQVALAQQDLRNAELQLANAKRMQEKGILSELQTENEQFALKNAQDAVELAERQLKVLDTLVREKNRIQLQSNIDAAKAKLDSDALALAEQREELQKLQEQIEKCIVHSPADGIVTYNNLQRGPRVVFVVEEGALVRERQCVIKLPDPTKMRVRAQVNECRIMQIEPDLPVIISVQGVSDQLVGRVSKVNRYAEPGEWFSAAVKEYVVEVDIEGSSDAIRTGMSAELKILLDEKPNALQIPIESVYEHDEILYCLKKNGPDWETVEITVAAANDENVMIGRGLQEGDEVALHPRQHLDLLELPDSDEIRDRDALLEIGSHAKKHE